jgi:hypothetical protein
MPSSKIPTRTTTQTGEERERAFLGLLRMSRLSEDLASVPAPDRHLDAEGGQMRVGGRAFDFAWSEARVLVELDGGQWLPGGGRHGGDDDRWKSMRAVAEGWRVIHLSPAQVQDDAARVLQLLKAALDAREPCPF